MKTDEVYQAIRRRKAGRGGMEDPPCRRSDCGRWLRQSEWQWILPKRLPQTRFFETKRKLRKGRFLQGCIGLGNVIQPLSNVEKTRHSGITVSSQAGPISGVYPPLHAPAPPAA